jgi:hypothetical protein
MRRVLPLLLGAFLQLASPVHAQSVTSGDITVYYNALPTSSLTADVARSYGITRSGSRILLNISVRRGVPGKDAVVPATVVASASNLAGQRQELRLREVREGEAAYHLGEARIQGNETLKFEIEVRPTDGGKPIRAVFRQEFFVQ